MDYVFVSREVFSGWVANGVMLEHAVVYGDYKVSHQTAVVSWRAVVKLQRCVDPTLILWGMYGPTSLK